jgi:hypothetical protein
MRASALVLACLCACSRKESPITPRPSEPETPATAPAPAAMREDAPPQVAAPPAPSTAADPNPPARSFDDVQGLTTAELVAHWGEPDEKTSARWTYRFPRTGCTEERLVYVLSMQAGTVAKIERRTEHTGRVCESIE